MALWADNIFKEVSFTTGLVFIGDVRFVSVSRRLQNALLEKTCTKQTFVLKQVS